MNDDAVFVSKLYLRSMSASMLALLGAVLGRIVSAVIIGNCLKGAALSVMAVVLPIQFLFSAAGALIGVGGTVVCARLTGKGHLEECRRAFTLMYLLIVLTAAVLALVLLTFLNPLVHFLGAPPEIFEDTKKYAAVLIKGGVFSMSVYPAFTILRLDGRFRIAAAVSFGTAALNILLDLALLFGLRMGVEAAAVSAVVSAAVSGILGTVFLFTGGRIFRFTPSVFKKVYRRNIFQSLRNMVRGGASDAVEYLCALGTTLVLNRLIAGSFGLTGLSAFKLIDSVNSFVLIFTLGISGPIAQFIGVFGPEKDSKSIRQLLAQVFLLGSPVILGAIILCEFFSPSLAGLFGMTSPEALAAAVPAIRIFAVSLFPALINYILAGVYRAGNRPHLANVINISRLFLWIAAAAPLLSSRFGLTGIWHSFWIAETAALLSALVLSMYFRGGSKYLVPVFLLDTEAESRGIYKSFSVGNNPESITKSSAGITEFCAQNNIGTKLTMAISLAIEEMLMLIRDHCFSAGDNAVMNVRVLITFDTVILRIRNGGQNFNPLDYVGRSGGDEAADVMGIKMILALAENIDYCNTFGINNTTVLLHGLHDGNSVV